MNKTRFNNVLLGLTTEGEIVFADVANRDGRFTVSFSTVTPFEWNEIELERRAESLVECIDDATKLSLLEDFDCSPSELVENIGQRYDIEDLVDISLYSEYIYKNGKEIYFESGSCGQVDVDRFDYEFMLDEQVFYSIIDAWKEYHLQTIPNTTWSKLQSLLMTYEEMIDDEEQIEEWLEKSAYVDVF